MDTETKMILAREVGEEIITEDDLRTLFETKAHPIAYDGFEPSGRIHIAQGMLRAINIAKLNKTGIRFKLWVADWFAWMNNKLEGDLEKIQTTGKYFIEVWKACGLDTKKVDFVWAKDSMADETYWKKVVNISRYSTVSRIMRCSQIMGRDESTSLSAAQILYPCMQCADIFHLKADIAQLGMDQRKVNVLAREIGPKIGYYKPVAMHHHMLLSLTEPPKKTLSATDRAIAMKMSKSKPDTAIFMTDTEKEIKRKINSAFCPPKQLEDNPLIDYSKHLIFQKYDTMLAVRPAKYGGNLEIHGFDELCKIYRTGELHPMDLKQSVSKSLNTMLEPVRIHFEKNKKAKALLEKVASYNVTR